MYKLLILLNVLALSKASQFGLPARNWVSPRITQGEEVADIIDFNYQVAITVYPTKSTRTFCDGALISPKFALTAAVCFQDTLHPKFITTILFGAANLQDARFQRIATKIRTHLGFDRPNKKRENNIAVVEFPPISLSEQIQTIGLPSFDDADKREAYDAILSGRGQSIKGENQSNRVLRHGITKVLEADTQCTNEGSLDFQEGKNLCTAKADTSSAICPGDVGSPLVRIVNGKKILVGLSSLHKNTDCEATSQSVFTKVAAFLEWINGVTGIDIS